MLSSSDPIALQDSSLADDKQNSTDTDSSTDQLNLGNVSRRGRLGNTSRGKDFRYLPYSPPGFFTDKHIKGPFRRIREGDGVGKRYEPEAIPTLSSHVREEQQLARDVSLGVSSEDDDFVTVMNASDRTAGTLRSRVQQPTTDGQKQMSSFDQLRLQHPFSDGSWRNSGFAVEPDLPVSDREVSSSSSDTEEDRKSEPRITQSWRQVIKPSLSTSSSTVAEEDADGESPEPNSDASDDASSIDSFSVEYPRSAAPRERLPSSLQPESEFDSLTAYGVTSRSSVSIRATQTMEHRHSQSPATRGHKSPLINTQPSAEAESTPLTRYAATLKTLKAIDDSSTLRVDYARNGSSRMVALKHVRNLERSSSGIGGTSTPLTVYQVAQKTASSRGFSSHKMTSTPLSDYAADRVTSIATKQVGLDCSAALKNGSSASGQKSSGNDTSVEHGRQLLDLPDADFVFEDIAKSASDHGYSSHSSSGSPQVTPSERRGAPSPIASQGNLHVPVRPSHQYLVAVDIPDLHPGPLNPSVMAPRRKLARRQHSETTKKAGKKPGLGGQATVSLNAFSCCQPSSYVSPKHALRPWGMTVNWKEIDEFELSVEYVV